MDNNTAKVLLAAIPSVAFVVIVALVIFGLSPGDCIEIESPGGGKITRCMPISDSESSASASEIDSILNQIEELRILQDSQQQQLMNTLKQSGEMEDVPSNFMMASSVFEKNQDSVSKQLQSLSSKESSILSRNISSDIQKVSQLSNVAEKLVSEGKNFSWTGKWKVTGTVGISDLPYEGQIIFKGDGTYEAQGDLDGKQVSGDGIFLIDERLGICTLSPSDLEPTQYSFVEIGDNSFIMWSPLDFEKLEFSLITS